MLSLDRRQFLQWGLDLGFPGLEDTLAQGNRQTLDPERFARVQGCLRRIFQPRRTESGPDPRPADARSDSRDLVPLLLEALAQQGHHSQRLARPPARIELVKAAQRWMADHPTEPITLDALCRQVAAGRRTLLQGFREQLGMGPMAFLKLRRLHGVRRELLAADPNTTTITELAVRWGFLNPGHFATTTACSSGNCPAPRSKPGAEGAERHRQPGHGTRGTSYCRRRSCGAAVPLGFQRPQRRAPRPFTAKDAR